MLVDVKDSITGEILQINSINLRKTYTTQKVVASDDIDLLAHKELGGQDFIKDLISHNSSVLVENLFDLEKISELSVPLL